MITPLAGPMFELEQHFLASDTSRGFCGVNSRRGRDENLAAPAMKFRPLAFQAGRTSSDAAQVLDAPSNRFDAHDVATRLAVLVKTLELELCTP